MKVLFISRRFYPDVIGGGQISAFYIAKAVKKQGAQVYVCTFTDKKEITEVIQGIKIFRLNIPKMKFFPRLSNMDYMYVQMAKLSSKIIEKVKPDVIHLLNFESVPLSAVYYKKKFGIPIVATVNGPLFGCFTQQGVDYKNETCIKCRVFKRINCSIDKWGNTKGSMYYLYSLWYMNMLKISYKYVDKFLCVSNAMIPLMENMSVQKEKMTVVYNPVEIKKKVKTNLKKRMGIEGKKVILYAGRLSELKGVQYTIMAMPHIDNAVFLVLGKKKGYYHELVKLTKELKVVDKVKFMGFISHDKLDEYYSIADVSVLICKFYEPLSRFLLESCSYGIPCVVSDVGGNSEIIKDEKNRYIVDPTNTVEIIKKLNILFQEKTIYAKFSNYSIENTNRYFSMNNVGIKIINTYD